MKNAAVYWISSITFIALFSLQISANEPPVPNGPSDTTFILGLSYALNSNSSDDSLTKWELIYSWVQLSGPQPGAEILASTSRNSAVDFAEPGEYVFELTVSDGELSAKDTVNVTVLPAIPFIILAPEAGDTIYTNKQYTITWQVYPPVGVHIQLSFDNGVTWERINDTKVESHDSFFVWNVPDTMPESDSCVLQVNEYDFPGNKAVSARFFIRAGSDKAIHHGFVNKMQAGSSEYGLYTVAGRHLKSEKTACHPGRVYPDAQGIVVLRPRGKGNSLKAAILSR